MNKSLDFWYDYFINQPLVEDNNMSKTSKEWQALLEDALSNILAKGYSKKRVQWTKDQTKMLRTCQNDGYKVIIGYLPDGLDDGKFHIILKQRKRGVNVPWTLVNMNPYGDEIGDCSTRALAYAFRSTLTYNQCKLKQFAAAQALGTKCWENRWRDVAEENGWKKITLNKHVTAAKVAEVLANRVKNPVFVKSRRHVAVVDNGAVVDSWDSRCKRILMVMVKRDEIDAAFDALHKSGISCTTYDAITA